MTRTALRKGSCTGKVGRIRNRKSPVTVATPTKSSAMPYSPSIVQHTNTQTFSSKLKTFTASQVG